MEIAASWARIDVVLKQHAPEAFTNLAGPVSEGALRELETLLGCALPEGLAESLRIHNGQRGTYMTSPFVDHQWLLSTTEIGAQWTMRNEVNEPLDPEWWAPHYIPFTDSEGNALAVDASSVGAPVRAHVHDEGMLEAALAPGLGDWLKRLADALEGGRFRVKDGGIWLQGEDGLALIYGP